MKRIGCLALAAALTLAGCGVREQTDGLYARAAGIAEDAVLMTVDGREVPAWRYLYWLTYDCDYLAGENGAPEWSAEQDGVPLAEYVKRQALDTAVLYATIEGWAEKYGCEPSEEDRGDMETDWASLCARYGGEEACLAALGWMGLDREMADGFTADYYRYAHLTELAQAEDGPLAQGRETLEAFAAERRACTVSTLFIANGSDQQTQTERRQRAELVAQKLSESAEPEVYFTTLAGLYADEEAPEEVTFLPGDGQLEETAEQAALALSAGEWSGPVETAGGWLVLLRRETDLDAVAAARFDEQLRQATAGARVTLSTEYKELDPETFYARLTAERAELGQDQAVEAFAAAAGAVSLEDP